MAEALLRCNVQVCRKRLEDEAVATSCSHVFCAEHGQEVIRSKSCLACGTKCRNKFDYIVNNLQPTDQCKSILLNGLNPEQILEIASRSIGFYTYQINQEGDIKDQVIKKSAQEKEEMQSYCNTMATNYKAEVEKLKKAAQTLKQELEEKIKETEKQREYIANCSRINKKLQLQLDSCRRQIVSLKGRNASAEFGTSPLQQAPPGNNLAENLQFNFTPGNHPHLAGAGDGIFGTIWPSSRHSH